jgi:hypothetical protein
MAIDIDEGKVRRSGAGFWLGWTLATAAGLLLGLVPFALLNTELPVQLVRVALPLWAGFLVGLFQWLVLRPYLTHPVDWVLNGGAGWAAGFALGLLVMDNLRGNPLGTLLGYLLFGLIVAVLQWPVLRREIPNAWAWVVASVVGWAAGAYLSQAVLPLVAGGDDPGPLVSSVVTSLVTGLVAGAITGLALMWLTRQPEAAHLRGRTAATAAPDQGSR